MLVISIFFAIWSKLKVEVFGLSILRIGDLCFKLVAVEHINLALGSSEYHLKSNPLTVDVGHEGFGVVAIVGLEFSILKVQHDSGSGGISLGAITSLDLEK